MSRTFTKLFFAVAMLFGLLNTAFADTYKATMKFGGIASGTSENVDAEITKDTNGVYAINFSGFNASIQFLGNVKGGSADVTSLSGSEPGELKNTSTSKLKIAGETLSITEFSATIDEDGNGSGSFVGSKNTGLMPIEASCEFTLVKFVDNDTTVTSEIALNDVPFYNKVIDLSKVGDTTLTNNDSTAVGIRLFGSKAEFAMADFEISVANLKMKQRMLLENLVWSKNKTTEDIHISGETTMAIENFNNMTVPATANITISKDSVINGTIDILANMLTFNYQITVVFGKQAEGVVIETKLLEYEKTTSYAVISDKEFANDSLIYYNNDGILIEDIHYSIVDQPMTLLIKEYEKAAPVILDTILSDKILQYSPTMIHANKAEAYITVKGEVVYLKDIDIELNLNVLESNAAFGSLTILDGGPATNEFIDPEGPIVFDMVGRNITMTVDTTGYGLDGYTADSEFNISGVYDQADGYIKTVKLADFAAAMEAAISEAKEKDGHGVEVEVVATDKAGNTTTFPVTCYAKPAPVEFEEIAPKLSSIRVVADSLTGKATVKIDSLIVEYVVKNEALGLKVTVGYTSAEASCAGTTYALPTEIELPVGNEVITYVWENICTGEMREASIDVKVYSTASNMTGVSNVANKAVSVIYKDGVLVVDGAKDANVSIVNISGATVYTGKAGAINLHKGIYIVKVNGKAYKAVVK